MLIRVLLCVMLTAGVLCGADADRPARVLMVTQSAGFRHGSVTRGPQKLAPAEIAMIQLGQKTECFRVDCTQDVQSDFTQSNLQNYDIVMLYTTGRLPIAQEDLDFFLDVWLRQAGHGVIGFHSATDTFKDYEPYRTMIGGAFAGHPWGSRSTVTITVHEPNNPLVQPFGSEFVIQDEIYQYRDWHPENVRVLMSLNMEKCTPSKPYHVPVAWVRSWGDGRVYYNNLGHNAETWTRPEFLDSVTAAVRWIRGELDAPVAPNPELSADQDRLAREAAGR